MTIRSVDEKAERGIEINLTSPSGNAYVLMRLAKDFCKQLDRDSKPIIEDMMSGDYEHLVAVFDREFGSLVTLYR